MRIAVASQNYLQPNNGQAVFVRNLAHGLAALGHPVLVVTPSNVGKPWSETALGVRVETLRSIPLNPFFSDVFVTFRPDREAASLLDDFRPEIVHIQDHFPLCRGIVRQSGARGIPRVGTNHFLPENIIPFVPVLSRFAGLRAWMAWYLWAGVLKVFDQLDAAVSPSETAAQILRTAGIQMPVRAISCGVSLTSFHPDPAVDRAAVRSRLGLSADRVLFMFLGRVDREKRVDVLLHALRLLDRRDVQLAVAGTGRDLGNLREQARRLNLGNRVVFLGFVREEDLPELLNAADVFAMPSEAELLSIATLEAMATGLPVLAADARALPELVTNGENGCLFRAGDPADAARCMGCLADEPAQRKAMGAAGIVRARAHDLPNTIARYTALYESVLADHSPIMGPAGPPHN